MIPEFSVPALESNPPDHKTERVSQYRISKENCRLCNNTEMLSIVNSVFKNKTREMFPFLPKDIIREADAAKYRLTDSILKHIESTKSPKHDFHATHEKQFQLEEDLETCIYLKTCADIFQGDSQYVIPADIRGKAEAPVIKAWLEVVDLTAQAYREQRSIGSKKPLVERMKIKALKAENVAAALHCSFLKV